LRIPNFFDVIYLKLIGFVLPNSYFTKKELDSVQSPAICAFIPKFGYNRNTKQAIIFGPKRLAGSGFKSLYHLQGEGQVLQFLKYWRTASQTSNLLRVSVSWSQYQACTKHSILTDVDSPLPHLGARWLPSMRKCLSRINGSIELDTGYVTPLQHIHDKHIIDQANNTTFSDADVILINYCRLYLQVTTISDMCNLDGITIDKALHSGELDSASSTSAWLHFTQGHPSTQAWILWRRLLTYWFDSKGMLHKPLGPWLLPANLLRCNWPTYHDAANDYLYVRHDTNASTFQRYSRLTKASLYDDVTTVTWTPQPRPHQHPLTHPEPPGNFWTPAPPSLPRQNRQFQKPLQNISEKSLFEGLDMPLDCYALIAAATASRESFWLSRPSLVLISAVLGYIFD
jgi:hypothetical protein